MTNRGTVGPIDDEKAEDGIVEYMRGPVKLIERARAKAQNDYAKEPYPASACVIDFNRCSLIFDDISSLLHGLQLFVNKVKYFQSGNIIAIARDKNGFKEYVKEAQYADIKLNVVIKGKHNSIIGEVQFLLRAMKESKDVAHNLYAIQRKEESLRSSVSATLPILMDQKKEIMRIGCGGSVKELCSLMILRNLSIEDVMFVDEESDNTILHHICNFGHLKMLKFLGSMMPREEFIQSLFHSNDIENPIECAIARSQLSTVRYLFDKYMKEVCDRYKNSDKKLKWIMFLGICRNSDVNLMNLVFRALEIEKEKVVQMLSYRGRQLPYAMSRNILNEIVCYSSLDNMRKLVAFIGEEAFVKNVFNLDRHSHDSVGCALYVDRPKFVKYLLEHDDIKKNYLSDEELLIRIVKDLRRVIKNRGKKANKIVEYVIDTLGLTQATLKALQHVIDISLVLPFMKQ